MISEPDQISPYPGDRSGLSSFLTVSIDGEVVIILVRPFFHARFHILDDIDRELFGFWIVFPIWTIKDGCDFIESDIAKRNGRSAMTEELIYLVILAQAFPEAPYW